MTDPTEISLKEIVASSANKRLILQGAGWDCYEELLKCFENSNALHFAFDNEFLEVEMPTPEREIPNCLLASFVSFVCAELEIDCANFGSSTIYNKSESKGIDPDTSFYIHNEPSVRGLLEFDTQRLPPDLVIEVDVATPSLDKLPILATLNVPEVWLYKGDKVVFYELVGENYKEIKNSLALPALDSTIATEFLHKGLKEGSSDWFRAVREWTQNAGRYYQQLFKLTSRAQAHRSKNK